MGKKECAKKNEHIEEDSGLTVVHAAIRMAGTVCQYSSEVLLPDDGREKCLSGHFGDPKQTQVGLTLTRSGCIPQHGILSLCLLR